MVHSHTIQFFPAKGSVARRVALFLCCIVPIVYGLAALYLGQDANWDLRNYHWYNPYALLNNRYGFDLLPSQLPYFYNPLLDVPFYLLASHSPAKCAFFLLACLQGVNFVLLFRLAFALIQHRHPMVKTCLCSLIAILGLLGAGTIAQIGTTFYDTVTSLGVLGSACLVVKNAGRFLGVVPGEFRLPVAFAGLPAGLMMGLKLPSVIFCLGLCCAFLLAGGSLFRRLQLAFFFGLGVSAGLMITYGYWGLYLYSHYQNPLFPYFASVFPSSYAPPVVYHDTTFVPARWLERLFFPLFFTMNPYRVGEIAWRDLRIPILYFLAPLCLVVSSLSVKAKRNQIERVRQYRLRYLFFFAACSYFFWLQLFSIYRYLLTLEMLAPLLIVLAIGLLPVSRAARIITLLSVFCLILATVQPGNWRRRESWSEKTIALSSMPAVSANSMILMAGFQPYSHVVPLFPKQIPFIRIESNFAGYQDQSTLNSQIRERVAAHSGPFHLLIPEPDMHQTTLALRSFNLQVDFSTCQVLRDTLSDFDLKFCNLSPIPSK